MGRINGLQRAADTRIMGRISGLQRVADTRIMGRISGLQRIEWAADTGITNRISCTLSREDFLHFAFCILHSAFAFCLLPFAFRIVLASVMPKGGSHATYAGRP